MNEAEFRITIARGEFGEIVGAIRRSISFARGHILDATVITRRGGFRVDVSQSKIGDSSDDGYSWRVSAAGVECDGPDMDTALTDWMRLTRVRLGLTLGEI